jgi:transcriptional regulator with XRE-family HTH domain
MLSLPALLNRLGRVIRDLRQRAGYSSQERFGDAIGLHRTYVGLLERGTTNPTMKTLHTVARGLGVSLLDLLTLAMTENAGQVPSQGETALAAPVEQAGDRAVEPPGRTRRE